MPPISSYKWYLQEEGDTPQLPQLPVPLPTLETICAPALPTLNPTPDMQVTSEPESVVLSLGEQEETEEGAAGILSYCYIL